MVELKDLEDHQHQVEVEMHLVVVEEVVLATEFQVHMVHLQVLQTLEEVVEEMLRQVTQEEIIQVVQVLLLSHTQFSAII